jgi:hypothetical protein
MVPAAAAFERLAEPDPEADATPWADRRDGDRRPARAGARVEVRRRDAGPGPDLAIALLDVSPSGLKVAIRGTVAAGDRLLIAVGPPGESSEYRGAVVRWCVPGAEGTALVGVRLQRPLTATELAEVSE